VKANRPPQLVSSGRMQTPPNTATTNAGGVLEVLATYYEAFAERDAGRRGELLARCLTPDAAIWGIAGSSPAMPLSRKR
jgi:hypothetical protein